MYTAISMYWTYQLFILDLTLNSPDVYHIGVLSHDIALSTLKWNGVQQFPKRSHLATVQNMHTPVSTIVHVYQKLFLCVHFLFLCWREYFNACHLYSDWHWNLLMPNCLREHVCLLNFYFAFRQLCWFNCLCQWFCVCPNGISRITQEHILKIPPQVHLD